MIELAEHIAREAGAILRDHALRPASELDIGSKSTPTDPVSAADLAAERRIRDILARERPDDAILGEEGGSSDGTTGLRWVVDPLDGTVNFLYGLPQFAVSVAVEDSRSGQTIAGAIYDPNRDECWTASADSGPFVDGVAVHGSTVETLDRALVATGFAYDPPTRAHQAGVMLELLPRARDVRRFGSAALDLAWTAAGRYDAYFERSVKPWDIAAGALMCERAGLEVRSLPAAGAIPSGILVAPASIVDELLGIATA